MNNEQYAHHLYTKRLEAYCGKSISSTEMETSLWRQRLVYTGRDLSNLGGYSSREGRDSSTEGETCLQRGGLLVESKTHLQRGRLIYRTFLFNGGAKLLSCPLIYTFSSFKSCLFTYPLVQKH
jgi:hypothetical protein